MKHPLSIPICCRNRWRAMAMQFLALVLMAGGAISEPRAQSAAESAALDPPGRVGSISLMAGPVELVDLQTGSREEAALNWPITAGWRLETGRLGRAEVRIGSTALRLDDNTTVDFARLDDDFMQIAVLRGSVALRLRNRDVLDEIEVLTQRERIAFADIGRYRIDVDQVPGQTAVTAFAGRANIDSAGSSFVVAAGQRGEISGPPVVRFQLLAATTDRFDEWIAARDARDDAIRSAGYVSRETTGVELLDDHGDWRTMNDYGAVWFPRTVPSGWAPYRHGRWAWVEPWGWTWVDEAPWGFAPFHYGRWVVVGGAWGWVPGVIVPRPVYAPALVAWFSAPGVSVSIGGPVGWFPLGPREVYVPAYRYSPRYLRVVNVQHVPNVERVTIVQTPRYVHRQRDRSTWISGDRFGRPGPVHGNVRPPPSEWRQYIARPQPPANVPNTKRRQDFDRGSPASAARPPINAVEPAPIVRPPRPGRVDAPRAVEVPRAVEAPRGAAAPRRIDVPRPEPARPPAVQPREPRGRGELPTVAPQPRAFSPPTPASPATVAPEPARPRDVAPGAVQRGRGELGAMPRDAQRHAPRPPAAPSVPAAAVQAPAAPSHGAPERNQARHPTPQRPPAARIDRSDDGRVDRPTGRSPREAMR